MTETIIGGVRVRHPFGMDEHEIREYINYVNKKSKQDLVYLEVKIDGDYVSLVYEYAPVPFDRIRRITGYLVGTMDNWNDSKSSEEHDRVKHGGMEVL